MSRLNGFSSGQVEDNVASVLCALLGSVLVSQSNNSYSDEVDNTESYMSLSGYLATALLLREVHDLQQGLDLTAAMPQHTLEEVVTKWKWTAIEDAVLVAEQLRADAAPIVEMLAWRNFLRRFNSHDVLERVMMPQAHAWWLPTEWKSTSLVSFVAVWMAMNDACSAAGMDVTRPEQWAYKLNMSASVDMFGSNTRLSLVAAHHKPLPTAGADPTHEWMRMLAALSSSTVAPPGSGRLTSTAQLEDLDTDELTHQEGLQSLTLWNFVGSFLAVVSGLVLMLRVEWIRRYGWPAAVFIVCWSAFIWFYITRPLMLLMAALGADEHSRGYVVSTVPFWSPLAIVLAICVTYACVGSHARRGSMVHRAIAVVYNVKHTDDVDWTWTPRLLSVRQITQSAEVFIQKIRRDGPNVIRLKSCLDRAVKRTRWALLGVTALSCVVIAAYVYTVPMNMAATSPTFDGTCLNQTATYITSLLACAPPSDLCRNVECSTGSSGCFVCTSGSATRRPEMIWGVLYWGIVWYFLCLGPLIASRVATKMRRRMGLALAPFVPFPSVLRAVDSDVHHWDFPRIPLFVPHNVHALLKLLEVIQEEQLQGGVMVMSMGLFFLLTFVLATIVMFWALWIASSSPANTFLLWYALPFSVTGLVTTALVVRSIVSIAELWDELPPAIDHTTRRLREAVRKLRQAELQLVPSSASSNGKAPPEDKAPPLARSITLPPALRSLNYAQGQQQDEEARLLLHNRTLSDVCRNIPNPSMLRHLPNPQDIGASADEVELTCRLLEELSDDMKRCKVGGVRILGVRMDAPRGATLAKLALLPTLNFALFLLNRYVLDL